MDAAPGIWMAEAVLDVQLVFGARSAMPTKGVLSLLGAPSVRGRPAAGAVLG